MEEKIIEGNRLKVSRQELSLIEEFMGYADGYLSEWVTWNDVMPAVEKIENLTDGNNYLYSFEMGKDWCAITTNDFTPETIVVKSVAGNKMQSVWEAVVYFIQLYNQTQQP